MRSASYSQLQDLADNVRRRQVIARATPLKRIFQPARGMLRGVASLAPTAGAEDKRLAYTTWHTDQAGGFDLRVVDADGSSEPGLASDPSSNSLVSAKVVAGREMIAISGAYGAMGGVVLVRATGGQVKQLVAAEAHLFASSFPSHSPGTR